MSVFGGFWLLFHTYPCEGGTRILGPIVGQTHGCSTSLSYSAVTGSVSLPREVQETLDLLGDDFRNFPSFLYASFDSGCVSPRSLRPLVHGSHLFGAVCYRGVHENADFLRDDIPDYFRIQRLLARQWYVYGVSLLGYGISRFFYVSVNSYRGVFWEILPEVFPYTALFGSKVDTWFVSLGGCSSTTDAWSRRAENCGAPAVAAR